jgi:hypothetical protein
MKTYSKWHAFELSTLDRREKSTNVGVEVAIVAESPKGPHELTDQHLVPDHAFNEMWSSRLTALSLLVGDFLVLFVKTSALTLNERRKGFLGGHVVPPSFNRVGDSI